MHEGYAYYILSALVAVLSIIAAYSAKKAMDRGLTYSAMVSTVWALSFIAAARVLHVIREFFELGEKFGKGPEMVEYTLYLVAYVLFVWLLNRTSKTRYTPGEATSEEI